MINSQIVNPSSIVVVGASENIKKPGGKVLKNILDGKFKGQLFGINPKSTKIQGISCFANTEDLPSVPELAIISIPSKFVINQVENLLSIGTRAFIVLSAGFKESGKEGEKLEKQLLDLVNNANASLIGPNCMGVLTTTYQGTFAGPVPILKTDGVDFASGSGATAAFIMEAGISMGLPFSSMFSVGNSAQNGVEEVLEYWDENYDPKKDARVKLLYMENIVKPNKFLKHTASLIKKGCDIAAIKAGASEAGNRAASSHTGAMASSNEAVSALFAKAGVIRCYSREELMLTAAVFLHKKPAGKRFAIITHAGGPGVMLSDTLSKSGFEIPHLKGDGIEKLKQRLYPGSSVANPIDFLATGTAEQLADIIDTVENKIDNIDAMAVIFGTPGLTDVTPVYKVIYDKMQTCKKPIFPVLPSVYTAKEAIENFKSWGGIAFSDEVLMGKILAQNYFKKDPDELNPVLPEIDEEKIRNIIENADNGYLFQSQTALLLDAAGISRVKQQSVTKFEDLKDNFNYPIVMKVEGIIHKTEVNGVVLNIRNKEEAKTAFNRLISIENSTGVLVQEMILGVELFAGAKYEEKFGHLMMFGLGGIFVELFKDVVKTLAPVGKEDVLKMLEKLKSYKFFEGFRGQKPVSAELFAESIVRLSTLLKIAPEIYEMDLNPLLGTSDYVKVVDARINIKK